MTVDQGIELANLFNNIAPSLIKLFQEMAASDDSRPIGEVIAAADAQFDLNIINAQIEILRKD